MDLNHKRKIVFPRLLPIASAILLLLSFPPFDFGLLAWIALVPVLCALAETEFRKKRKWKLSYYDAQLIGILFGIVFYYSALSWIFNIFGILAAPLIAIMVFYVFVFVFCLNFLWSRSRGPAAMVLFPPILWVAIEFIKSEGWWGRFAWLNLGYTQHNCLPVLQFASILGQYGVSFLIVLANAAIALLITSRSRKRFLALVAAAVVAGLILLNGFLSLNETYQPDINVGLVQDESSELPVYAGLMRTLRDDVDVVVWPEYAVPEFVTEENVLMDRLFELTAEKTCYLIIGAKERSDRPASIIRANMMRLQGIPDEVITDSLYFFNTGYLISPQGVIAGSYHKNNPIQFFNDGAPGREFPSFETLFGNAGILICYDADYSSVARNVVRNGAEMLFIPTYDAVGWGEAQHEQHSAMTSMRAVENRRFVARATTSGVSQVIDPHGRITCRIENGQSGVATGFIQPIAEKTFYTRRGYLFPYLCVSASVVLIVAAVLNRSPASQIQKVSPPSPSFRNLFIDCL